MIRRVSATYPPPTLVDGIPVGWARDDALVVEEWGELRVEIGAVWDCSYTATTHELPTVTTPGTDYTAFRGKAIRVESLAFGEPYGETTGLLTIPAVSVFDDVDTLFPRFVNVDVYRVLPAPLAALHGRSEVPYWCGFVASFDRSDGKGLTSGVSLHLVGALHGETSLRQHQPIMIEEATAPDVGTQLGRCLHPASYSRPLAPFRFYFESTETAIRIRHRGSRGQKVAEYLDELLALAQEGSHQWTISRAYDGDGFPQARKYTLREKPAAGIEQLTVTAGGYGVSLSMSRDDTEAPNAYYVEGIAEDGSRYRNAKFPMLTPVAPEHPSRLTGSTYPIGLGDVDADFTADVITQLQYQLRGAAYPDVEVNGTFDADTVAAVEAYQDAMGLTDDGQIGSNGEWDAVWATGAADNELGSGYFQPIALDHRAEPWTYYPNGAVSGDNDTGGTAYDGRMRVEEMISGGDKVRKSRLRKYAKKRLAAAADEPWIGSVTLTADPEEMGRLSIREGSRITIANFEGGLDFHVAGVSHSPEGSGAPTTLTLARTAFDLLDLSTRIERNRAARENPGKSFYAQKNRVSRPFRDAVGWDKESGAGLIAPVVLAADTWNRIRFVGGQRGTIEMIRAWTKGDACTYAIAVFGSDVDVADLNALIPNPLAEEPDGYGWFHHPDNEATLDGWHLVEAWGEFNGAAGYAPGRDGQTPAAALTGRLKDELAWQFASLDPPFLYGYVYPTAVCTFSAEMRMAVEE